MTRKDATIDYEQLARRAWEVRSNARILGRTAVGCVVLGASGKLYAGCNIEHQFRSHDIHAETNAISTMISSGERRAVVVMVAAERERFTPCGACMDWIFEFGGPDCEVAWQPNPDGRIVIMTAHELMPFYPR